MVARVVVDAGLDRVFDYDVPVDLLARVVPGVRVRVPFGHRTATGYVIALAEHSAQTALKALASVEGDGPYLLPGVLELARWIADYYLAPIERCVRAVLPAAVQEGRSRPRERLFVSLPAVSAEPGKPAHESRGGVAKPPVAPAPDTAVAPVPLNTRQQELLDNIRRVGGGWLQSVCREFRCAPDTVRRLAAAGHLTLDVREARRDPLANRRVLPSHPLVLMDEQATALAQVIAACDSPAPQPVLLYGVTGSGKTEVYLQAIAHVLARGQGAIVLVPEISLTPQTVQRFAARFGERVAVLHSALSDGERHDEWHRIRRGDARVVIGPRSAVFAPVAPLGLIVVDEEHEPSYKQDETPRYHARDVAVMRGHIEHCGVLLGSATPALESWDNVRRGKYTLTRIARRVDDRPMPLVRIVDMRVEMARSGHVQVFSEALLLALGERLTLGEQAMLFINRRGYATSLLCPRCGFVATCDACSVAFTYHQADQCLRCHICGAWQPVPAVCPKCRDPAIKYSGFGTQRVESIIQTCFPQARVARMDADVTARRHSHDEILGAFRTGRTDILIGTQMIAKGLHFPNVTLVGVVMADASLHLPDFRAGERTFQLLAQVSGRAGRGDVAGEVIIQTYTPHHPAVAVAREADFDAFAAGELPERRELGYPPYAHLVCLTFRGVSLERTELTAKSLAAACQTGAAGSAIRVSEACAAPLARAKGYYRFQVMLRAPQTGPMVRLLRRVLGASRLPKDIALAVDVDAVSLL